MAKKRDQIKMSDDEVARFLDEQRVMNVSTIGPDGWPHMTSLWYVMRDTEPWVWTYASPRRCRTSSATRAPRCWSRRARSTTSCVGVMLKTRADLHADFETVAAVAEDLLQVPGRQAGSIDDATREALRSQAAKRVAIQFQVEETVSWDHAKLGGAY